MSAAQCLLDRLDRPRQIGAGRWMAACPCCQSRKGRPVSVRELEDGRVLLHAFCGCETGAILSALGLSLADLFDKPLDHSKQPVRAGGLSASVALALASHEMDTAAILLADAAGGRSLTADELRRLAEAASRVGTLRSLTSA